MALIVLAGCPPAPAPCGWDDALSVGAEYDVELLELYTAASTTAFYAPELGLTRPAETCAGFDEIEVGRPMVIRLDAVGTGQLSCSFWIAEMLTPLISIGTRNPLLINNQSSNQITVSGRRDLGGGCEGGWEFSLHAPHDDPFREQAPDAEPVLMAYRVFGTEEPTNAACSALVGRAPTSGFFTCGDAFVARMTLR